MNAEFAEVAFAKPEQASRVLEHILPRESPAVAANLARALEESANADAALLRLERFLDASPVRENMIARFAEHVHFARMVVTLLSQSHFLTDYACRKPELIPWLWDSAERTRARTAEEMLRDLLACPNVPGSFAATCEAMRLFRQREIARIAVRDIFEHAHVLSLTEDLANLADATLETALRAARQEVTRRYGRPMHETPGAPPVEAGFVVFGMGKLGGRELNFSSDIDLLFVYSDEGETSGDGGRVVSNAEYFCKLGELLIKAISEQTAEGQIFRVDMRLRPFGSTGPLAVSLDVAVDYYMNYGRAWERQALIKARACAGDLALGERFLERLRPFIFPRYFDDATLEDIRETKRQAENYITQRGEAEREVKLGRGGIRDIEFTVQMLQLLNGGVWPELRTPNTLKAIEVLGLRHYLSAFEVDALSSHYVFLRGVEHRLQIEGGRQRHALPDSPAELDELARRLGYKDGESFLHIYRDRTSETRAILDRFLAAKGSGNLWVADLLNPRSSGATGLERLRELGFADPETARAELLRLCIGESERPHTQHVRQYFVEIAPLLIRALSEAADPDRALVRLAGLLPRIEAPGALYQVLKSNAELPRDLVRLASNSEYLTTILVRDPGLLELLGNAQAVNTPATREELKEELCFLEGAFDREAALYRLRDGAMLRVGLRDLSRNISIAEVGDELTLIAEVILERAVAQAREWAGGRYGSTETSFAVFGLGKLGGWEMGYGSDLDLVFVYDSDGPGTEAMGAQEYFASVASKAINRITEHTRFGSLYDIDARLRPDGNKGMLAVGHRRLEEYYATEAQPWERLALMKVRAVAGDLRFGLRVERRAKELAFSLPMNGETLEQIETLRYKLAEQASTLDLKRSAGGIGEIEFTTRLWQLEHVRELPELRRGDVFGALDILRENEIGNREEIQTLYEAYGQLRRILNRIRMMHGGHATELPDSEEARVELGARLGIQGNLMDFVRVHKERVHAIYVATRARLNG